MSSRCPGCCGIPTASGLQVRVQCCCRQYWPATSPDLRLTCGIGGAAGGALVACVRCCLSVSTRHCAACTNGHGPLCQAWHSLRSLSCAADGSIDHAQCSLRLVCYTLERWPPQSTGKVKPCRSQPVSAVAAVQSYRTKGRHRKVVMKTVNPILSVAWYHFDGK